MNQSQSTSPRSTSVPLLASTMRGQRADSARRRTTTWPSTATTHPLSESEETPLLPVASTDTMIASDTHVSSICFSPRALLVGASRF